MILIAGPCIAESKQLCDEVEQKLQECIANKPKVDFYFKASMIKDNRTRFENYRGPGFEVGIEYLADIKAKGTKLCTDFHSPAQVKTWGEFFDMIQIPAFLSRQNSLVEEALSFGKAHGKIVHIKRMPDMDLNTMYNFATFPTEKAFPMQSLYITHRGTFHGDRLLTFDPRDFVQIRQHFPQALVDITHVNKNSFYCKNEQGAEIMGMAALAAGAKGIFMEVHTNPAKALCDSGTQVPTLAVGKLLDNFYAMWEFIQTRELRYK